MDTSAALYPLSYAAPQQITCPYQPPSYTYVEAVLTSPAPSDPANWTANGTINTNNPGGNYLWKQTPANWNAEYEIRTYIKLINGGGRYQHYVRAQPGALGPSGTSYIVELQDPVISTTGQYTATLSSYEVVNGVTTLVSQSPVPCSPTTVMRTVVFGNIVYTMINGQIFGSSYTSLTGGAPGYGAFNVPAGNGITQVSIGPRNPASATPVDTSTIATSPFPDHVDIRWRDPADTTGVGVPQHMLWRNDGNGGTQLTYIAGSAEGGSITDNTVQPQKTYLYSICDVTFHGVWSGCSPTVAFATPAWPTSIVTTGPPG